MAVEWVKVDKYGRKVGKVLLDAKEINLEQVKRGMAWHCKAHGREQLAIDRRVYADT